jgi:predicted lipid-binding transport protein (Tim44 family)
VLYGFSLMLFGADHVGGATSWLLLVGVLAFGIWSIVIPALSGNDQVPAQQGAPPNSRPASQLPASAEVQTPDSLRTPSSGGCG